MNPTSSSATLRRIVTTALAVATTHLCVVAPARATAPTSCLAQDLDASGAVDGADLGALLAAWGPAGGLGPADFDRSGTVDGADLGHLLSAWGDVPASSCLEIESIMPTSGAAGTEVTLTGTFPDASPLNYALCAKSADGTIIPFQVTAATSTTLTATVGPFPSGTGPATLILGVGDGNAIPLDALPGGANFNKDKPWAWLSTGASFDSTVEFTPESAAAPIEGTFFGVIEEGGLVVQLTGDCTEGTSFRVWLRARQERSGGEPFAEASLYIPQMTLEESQSPFGCGTLICNVLNAIHNAQTPNPVEGDCLVTPGDDSVGVGSYVDSITVNSGAFIVEVLPAQR